MTSSQVLVWIVVGLISGWLAAQLVRGGGLGLVGDIVIGIVGAFLGGLLFRSLGWHAPFHGMAGTICIAFVGAALLLIVLRIIRRGTASP